MRTVPSSATRNSAHLRKRRPRSHSTGAITWWRSLERSVYADLNRLRQSQPEGLRGAEVDDQLEADGLLHREIGRVGASCDLVHVRGRIPEGVGWPRPVCHEPGRFGELLVRGECGYAALEREQGEPTRVRVQHWIPEHKEAVALPLLQREHRALEVVRASRLVEVKLDSEGPGGRGKRLQHRRMAGIGRVPQHADPTGGRDGLLEHLELFAGKGG